MDSEKHSNENFDILTNYPRSYASTTESQINRSRAWSEDVTKHWNVPITGLETLNERAQRYLVYFEMTIEQLKCIHNRLLSEVQLGLNSHCDNVPKDFPNCSLKMMDTYVTEEFIPSGKEKGTSYTLKFGGTEATVASAAKVQLEGNGKMTVTEITQNLQESTSEFPKGLLDSKATASMLFESLADLTKRLRDLKGVSLNNVEIPLGVSIGFPIEQRGIAQASLAYWTKGYETGRKTNDPVEGMDIVALLECAFWRRKANTKVVALLNDAVAVLLAAAYEKPTFSPSCTAAFNIGCGVNGCYIEPDAQAKYGYKGSVINCELGSFDKSLPVNDVDLEVDFGDEATEGVQIFEKMVSTTYLGELCRRLIVKVWQSEAPPLAWVRHSIPWTACARIIENQDETTFSATDEILMGLWDWETTIEQRRAVRKLFMAVFERAAALTAVAVVVLSSRTGRLQPAMGGVTCAVSGNLYEKCLFYRSCLKKYIQFILPKSMVDCIHLYQVNDAVSKGTGVLSFLV